MKVSKQTIFPVNFKVYMTSSEKALVDEFFRENKKLKKGEATKGWILSGIAAEGKAS